MEETLPVFFALSSIFVLTILFKYWSISSTKKTSNKPPSPPGYPVIGNLFQLGHHPHRSLHSLALRYGPIMLLHIGHAPVLVVSSADVTKDIFKTYDRAFSSRPKLKSFDKLMYGGRDVAFAPYGESWRQKKSICVLHLLSNTMVRSFRNTREEEIKLMMKKIERKSSSSSAVNLNELFLTLTADIICRSAFGRKYIGQEGMINVNELLGNLVELLGGFYVGDYIPWLVWIDKIRGVQDKIERTVKRFDDFFEHVIQERLDHQNYQERSDIVDVLLSIQKEKHDGVEIDKVDVKALLMDMFVGGTETTHALLEWTMTVLLKHPEVMNKLRDEIHTFSSLKSFVSEDEIQRMQYLRAVIKEVLRLYPPVPLLVARTTTEDVMLKGYNIEAGTQVLINEWVLGREIATWGDDAEEFRPERFIDSSMDFRGNNFGFIPFGAGRRICPGVAFAMATTELALANIVHCFDWKMADGQAPGESDIPETTGATMHPKFPLVAYASPVSYG